MALGLLVLLSFGSAAVLLNAVFGCLWFRSRRRGQRHRFGSFAPVHPAGNEEGSPRNVIKWLVDGSEYMSAVADAIMAAHREIFITGLILNPHIFLKRGSGNSEWRLDRMLLKKADNGVRIYIILFNITSIGQIVKNISHGIPYTMATLRHRNIKFVLHPSDISVLRHGFEGVGLWTHHEKIVVVDRTVGFLGGIDLTYGRWDTPNHQMTDDYPLHPNLQDETRDDGSIASDHELLTGDHGLPTGDDGPVTVERYRQWIGVDFKNPYVEGGEIEDYTKPWVDIINRGTSVRLPFHDVGCCVTGPVVQDVVKHFVQRYNSAERCWEVWRRLRINVRSRMSTPRLNAFINSLIPDPSSGDVTIQFLRSVDDWSAGQAHEDSIYRAYLSSIRNSKHFIYIENQFFISSQPGALIDVDNEISATLSERIISAHQNNQPFHVMIVMPPKPDFVGDWTDEDRNDLKAVVYWNNSSLFTGEHSLFNRLKNGGIPEDLIPQYFSVYSLRTHEELNGKLLTEIVYVHSKVMIVDDVVTIIGSANINDRSMLGDRDSEVAVIVQDSEVIPGTMNGQPYQFGKSAHSLRCHLVREHLGLLENEKYEASPIKIEDPLSSFGDIRTIAVENTALYEQVFGGMIDMTDKVHSIDQLKEWRTQPSMAETDPEQAKAELVKIRGHLVTNPVHFLKDDLHPEPLDIFDPFT